METKTFNTAQELKREIESTFPNKIVDSINGEKVKLLSVSNKHVYDEYTGKSFNGELTVIFN